MFLKDRLNDLFYEIQKKGEVNVKDLSKNFSVSEDSIRKDLKVLEKEGLITRIYGGAKLKRSLYKRTLNSRLTENFENKYIIAEKAFKLIEDNDTLFLDTSTINIILTEMILKSDKVVTIVTNMLDVVNVFSEISNNSVLIGVGGIFKGKQKGFNGSETIKEIEKYNIDKAFVGTGGINVYNGNISTYDSDDGLTKSAIIKSSLYTYIISEKVKLEKDSFYTFANLEEVKGCIFDKLEDEILLEKLKEYEIEIY